MVKTVEDVMDMIVENNIEMIDFKGLPTSLGEALDALEADNDYLTAGGVFPKELIDNLFKTKRAEVAKLSAIPTPAEFDMYYNM